MRGASMVAQAVAASGGGSLDGGESSSSAAFGPSLPPAELTAKMAAARWIPLRLTEAERSTLRVLEGALLVSEYTDTVDVPSWRMNKSGRIINSLQEVLGSLTGLAVAASYRDGALLCSRGIGDNGDYFRSVFEIGRRYKMMNPDKMRSSYGKLVYMMQDAGSADVQRAVGFAVRNQIQTVQSELSAMGALSLLDDPDVGAAVAPVLTAEGRQAKDEATARLVERYGGADAAARASVERCLLSIGDDVALTEAHVAPVDAMLGLLRQHFTPTGTPDRASSLAITAGRAGARLTHSHSAQYAYVEQSLLLWRAILVQLPRMWATAEEDLLGGGDYRLRDTGQGYHRVQSAPRVGRFMGEVLASLQGQVGGWVGSSAVHLGDNDVPNAQVWIDKYTQVPRILTPLLTAVDALNSLDAAPGVTVYVTAAFGSPDACRMAMLTDFFRHGFDGSGADNYYDAGSCIDGRLTSAWNWCSKISKKAYYPLFKMTGFVGFDGSFSK